MSKDSARPRAGNGTGSPRPLRRAGKTAAKARLGKTLDSQVDPAAAAFPINLLSRDPSPAPLQSGEGRSILIGRMATTAVFWDRDNTLIEDPGYLDDPEQVKLLPGAADALRRLAEAGYQNIIITNQSGIARGRLDEARLEQIHDKLRQLLEAENAVVDAIYYCPYLDGPDAVVEKFRMASDLRKPAPGMLAKASLERQIELTGSWMVGNSLTDTQAGRAAGCRTILIANGQPAERDRSVDFVAASLDEASRIILQHTPGADAIATASNTPATPPLAPDDRTATAAQEILAFLRMVDRRQRAEDFSLPRLVGIVAQMLMAAVLVWAVIGIIQGDAYGAQIVRLLLAMVLQVLALTCFILPSRR